MKCHVRSPRGGKQPQNDAKQLRGDMKRPENDCRGVFEGTVYVCVRGPLSTIMSNNVCYHLRILKVVYDAELLMMCGWFLNETRAWNVNFNTSWLISRRSTSCLNATLPQNDILCYSISHMFYFLPYKVFKLVFESPLKFLKLHQHLDVEPDLQREITDTQLDVLNQSRFTNEDWFDFIWFDLKYFSS